MDFFTRTLWKIGLRCFFLTTPLCLSGCGFFISLESPKVQMGIMTKAENNEIDRILSQDEASSVKECNHGED